MTHAEVTKKYYGTTYQEPGYKPECVAWAKLYCKARGYPIKAFGGSAINGWNTGSPFDSNWIRVPYKLGMVPPEGAIIYWSEKRCKDGHVGVGNKFSNALVLRFSDQNGTGNRDKIQPRWSTYLNVLGWYIRK